MIDFKVSLHGAELQSLQKDGKEYLWHGDLKYWGRRSPILFPMVGKVYGGAFRVDGKEYPMGQHGFARDSEFRKEGERYVLDGCYLTELSASVPMPVDEDGLLPITADTFAIDTFMLEHGAVKSVTLLDKNKQPYLRVGSDQAEAYGLWAPHKPGCPFVCLEPWCGITDLVGFTGELKDRYLNHSLQPGEKFEFTYWIELL